VTTTKYKVFPSSSSSSRAKSTHFIDLPKSAHCNKMAQHANKSIDKTRGGAEGEEVK